MKGVLQIGFTLLFVVTASYILSRIPNKSNVPKGIMIPVIVALLAKYTLGDWDTGFAWTAIDPIFWGAVLGSSFGTVSAVSS